MTGALAGGRRCLEAASAFLSARSADALYSTVRRSTSPMHHLLPFLLLVLQQLDNLLGGRAVLLKVKSPNEERSKIESESCETALELFL